MLQKASCWRLGFRTFERPRVIRFVSEARPEESGSYRFYGKKVFLSMGKYYDKLVSFSKIRGVTTVSIRVFNTRQRNVHRERRLGYNGHATQSNSVELKGTGREQILTKVA